MTHSWRGRNAACALALVHFIRAWWSPAWVKRTNGHISFAAIAFWRGEEQYSGQPLPRAFWIVGESTIVEPRIRSTAAVCHESSPSFRDGS